MMDPQTSRPGRYCPTPLKYTSGTISDLNLPSDSRVVCLYRDDRFILPNEETSLKADDEVVVITHRRKLEELANRWAP